MKIPPAVRDAVERRLGTVRDARPLGGGCVNSAYRLHLADGPIFLKFNDAVPPAVFQVEAEGLEALRRAAPAGLRVPAVLAAGDGAEGAGWLALEWLEPVAPGPRFGRRLGEALAALHAAPAAGWGWERDGYIGPLPQPNGAEPGWADFWWRRRLEPQLRLARQAGVAPREREEWDRLAAALPRLLAAGDAEGPSLLHGDLWGGNVMTTADGPALIDPAVYRGHREVDLAMTELFGGFDPEFHAAYQAAHPLAPGYAEVRRPVYQLFYLLVHVNLFGGGYLRQTETALRRALAAA